MPAKIAFSRAAARRRRTVETYPRSRNASPSFCLHVAGGLFGEGDGQDAAAVRAACHQAFEVPFRPGTVVFPEPGPATMQVSRMGSWTATASSWRMVNPTMATPPRAPLCPTRNGTRRGEIARAADIFSRIGRGRVLHDLHGSHPRYAAWSRWPARAIPAGMARSIPFVECRPSAPNRTCPPRAIRRAARLPVRRAGAAEGLHRQPDSWVP